MLITRFRKITELIHETCSTGWWWYLQVNGSHGEIESSAAGDPLFCLLDRTRFLSHFFRLGRSDKHNDEMNLMNVFSPFMVFISNQTLCLPCLGSFRYYS